MLTDLIIATDYNKLTCKQFFSFTAVRNLQCEPRAKQMPQVRIELTTFRL